MLFSIPVMKFQRLEAAPFNLAFTSSSKPCLLTKLGLVRIDA